MSFTTVTDNCNLLSNQIINSNPRQKGVVYSKARSKPMNKVSAGEECSVGITRSMIQAKKGTAKPHVYQIFIQYVTAFSIND